MKSFVIQYGTAATGKSHYGGPLVPDIIAEVNQETPIRDPGTVSKLITQASATSSDSTMTLRKNQVNTALTVGYSVAQTGIKEDTSNSVTVADGDELTWGLTGNSTFRILGSQFEPDNPSYATSFMVCGDISSLNMNTASANFAFIPNSIPSSASTTESWNTWRVRKSFTAADFYVYIFANARTTDTTFRTRKSSTNGNQSVVYTAAQTGAKEDTSNTDSLAAGDNYNYRATLGTGVGDIEVVTISTALTSTNGNFVFLTGEGQEETVNFNVTTYFGCAGRMVQTTTEANTRVYPRFDFYAKELGTYVSANDIATSPTVITFRRSGVDTLLSVSYSAAQTGLKNDSAETVLVLSGTDTINYKVVTPNTSGSLDFRWMSVLGETSQPYIGTHFYLKQGFQ